MSTGQTDGRTPDRYIKLSAVDAANVINYARLTSGKISRGTRKTVEEMESTVTNDLGEMTMKDVTVAAAAAAKERQQ